MKPTRMKKKNMLVRLGVFAFAAYVVVSLVTLQMDISSKRSQLVLIENQIQAQTEINKETERLISFSDDKSYLGRIARDKLDMGFPDEHVFRDASGS